MLNMETPVEPASCCSLSVASVFDQLDLHDPLLPFARLAHQQYFGSPHGWDSEGSAPPRPALVTHQYLYPTLTENEYDRLMVLWYYTKDIQNDTQLLNRFSQMLEIMTNYVGWEIAIVGLVEAEHFVKVATRNIPLAVTPRRESTCSHTITQKPGTVFSIPDMTKDWRFVGSPPTKYGGLKSYAGTQMHLPLPNGDEVAFGTLCVASTEKRATLTEEQKESLIKAAEVMTGEILMSKRLKRLQEKQSMVESLALIRARAHSERVEPDIVNELFQRYPQCLPAVASIRNNCIELSSGQLIPLATVKNGIWEDTAFVKSAIDCGDFERSIHGRFIRMVVAHVKPNEQVIVIPTSKLRNVFDELDVWFVDQCAQVLNASAQAWLLREALAAKNTFLRSITHELRTPIHAILSSVELAHEEIKASHKQNGHTGSGALGTTLAPFLDTIRRSGTDLMTTVNNILRLNTFESDMRSYPSEYNLQQLERDVLDEVFQNYSEGQMSSLSVRFEVEVPQSAAVAHIDGDLLKELLKCLVLNAINATSHGSVLVRIKLSERHDLLVFDVTDTGTGIAEVDHQRIFQAFEKVNVHSSGAGLGLSLASQMASTLGGRLSLVSSHIGCGSHFQVEIPYAAVGVKNLSEISIQTSRKHMPTSYILPRRSQRNVHLVDHLERYLVKSGISRSEVAQDSIVLMHHPPTFEDDDSDFIRSLNGPHVILFVCDASPSLQAQDSFREKFRDHLVFPISGPLFTSRLDEIFAKINSKYSAIRRDLSSVATHPEAKLVSNLASDSSADVTSVNVATPPSTPGAELKKLNFPITPPQPKIKALLVDDNSVNLSVLQMYCKRRRLSHGTAVNGNEAVSQYLQSLALSSADSVPYNLILMDLQMPECDGIEACKQIRSHEKKHDLKPSIILILTGQDSATDRRDAFQAGCDNYYVKPVSVKKLDQAIAQHFPTHPG